MHHPHRLCTLSKTIMFDLKPIWSKFHSLLWEHDDHIGIILSTFRDYFRDLSLWLPPFFCTKCIRNCLEHLLETYVESFFANTTCRLDAKTKAALLEKDRLTLLQFFGTENSSEEMKRIGLGGICDVESRLEILKAMQNIMLAGSPSNVSSEIKVIVAELGNHNVAAAVKYLRAISDGQPKKKQEVVLWSTAIDDACKANSTTTIDAGSEQCEVSQFHKSCTLGMTETKKKTPQNILHSGGKTKKNQIQHGVMARLNQTKASTEHVFEKLKPMPKVLLATTKYNVQCAVSKAIAKPLDSASCLDSFYYCLLCCVN